MCIRIFVVMLSIAFTFHLDAQVVSQEILTSDHGGTIELPGALTDSEVRHEWIFESQSGLRTDYVLNLYVNGELYNSSAVRIRNLSIALYVDVRLVDIEGRLHTLSGIYDKGNKWLRVKMSPHKQCRMDNALWGRRNNIKDFAEILEFVILQMNQNLVLDCFKIK